MNENINETIIQQADNLPPEPGSRVYVLTDEQNRITRCEGGYTMSNITNPDEWTLIDEGYGDRYNLCQSHYFPDGLYTFDGIPRYRLTGVEDEAGHALFVPRTADEIAADRAEIPPLPPSPTERITALEASADAANIAIQDADAMNVDQEYRLTLLELGV